MYILIYLIKARGVPKLKKIVFIEIKYSKRRICVSFEKKRENR